MTRFETDFDSLAGRSPGTPTMLEHARSSRPGSARIAREKKTIAAMMRIHCRSRHGMSEALCDACAGLLHYAECRLDRCPFGAAKPTCVQCPIHCYKPEMRDRVREVMRFAGPRMLWRHPILAIRHLMDGRRMRQTVLGPR